jgi:phosphoribosylamine--glycine ligase
VTNVLVVGNGAREHALAWKLAQSSHVSRIFVAPGNPGTASVAENVPVAIDDCDGILRTVESCDIGLTVIGPEAALATGVQDLLRSHGHACVGPDEYGFQLEGSKSFAKEVMERAGVPTARWQVFSDYDAAVEFVCLFDGSVVVKANGLAAGKGVTVCGSTDDALVAVREALLDWRFGSAGRSIIVEERLEGIEVSLMCLVDGTKAVALPVAQDHKRLLDGDAGPNTGGMGAYAPVPFLGRAQVDALVEATVTPVVADLARSGHPYRGILFAGLILTDSGPYVLEYNCRFGDPETEVVLPLVDQDLFLLLQAVADGSLPAHIATTANSTAAVILAAHGYPAEPRTGDVIEGINEPGNCLVFHAATAINGDGKLRTAGGRVLAVVGSGDDLHQALAAAYASPIRFGGMHRRGDIGHHALGLGYDAYNHDTANPPSTKMRIAVLASGGGSNLQALIDAERAGFLQADICFVVSHDVDAGSLRRAHDAALPHAYVPIANRRDPVSRRAHESALVETIRQRSPDLIVLAGWMLVLSENAIRALNTPIINVHPALLPVEGEPLDVPILRGAHAVRDALELGLPYTGASVHYVIPEVDAGPVIARESVTITSVDDEASLYVRLKLVEHQLLINAVKQLAETRDQMRGAANRTESGTPSIHSSHHS